MPDFPDTFSGALGGATLGVQQQQANTQERSVGNNFNIAQEQLKLTQQQQQNQQQRELFARADKERTNLMTVTSETIEALKLHGVDTATIAKQIQPLVQAAKRLAKSSGTDDTAIDAQVAATLAAPANAKTQADLTKPTKMGVSDVGTDIYGSFDPQAGRYKTNNLSDQNVISQTVEDAPLPGTGQQPAAPAADTGIKTPLTRQQNAIVTRIGSTPEQFDFLAMRSALGDTTAGQGLRSYKGINPKTMLESRAAQYYIDKGLPPMEAVNAIAENRAKNRGAATIGNLIGRMDVAIEKARNTQQRVVETTKGLDLTEFPSYNKFDMWLKEQTGSAKINPARIAIETYITNYAFAYGAGNSVMTDFARKRASELLYLGMTHGQIAASLQQLDKELVSELGGSKKALKTFLGGSNIEEQPAAPSSPAAAPGPSGTSGGIKWSIEP